MFFGKPKPTVTQEDKEWIEDAFLWLEQEYTREYLKSVRVIEPTKEFFPINFKGTEENANELATIICDYMGIKDAEINFHYFSDQPLELTDGISTTQNETGSKLENKGALGTYSETGFKKYSIGLELGLLSKSTNLIATIAHELSHLVLLGEGRLSENDEELTDLNCIALGFGIFICNSIFSFNQWQGSSHQGWQAQRSGYIPEEVATYALALMAEYQSMTDLSWTQYLNPSPKKMFDKNIKYLKTTTDEIKFK
ncbi:MAG: hypothetical protein ABJH04_11180 [Cyclobacteriaceae bacterium]